MVSPIETPRLVLREFALGDADAMHLYGSDPEAVRHMQWGPNTRAETDAFLLQLLEWQREEPRRLYELAIERREDGSLIGGCGIRPSGHEAEIGYILRRDCWRKGYASEAAAALLAFGFGTLGLHRIHATCSPENEGSVGVLEKIGMRREGYFRRHIWQRDHWRDSYFYAIVEDEWAPGR